VTHISATPPPLLTPSTWHPSQWSGCKEKENLLISDLASGIAVGCSSFFFGPKKAHFSYCGSSDGSDGNGSGRSSSGNTGRSTHLFPAPRVIPCVVNGSLVGAFLPKTLIPPNHPQRVVIEWAAKVMRDSQWYSICRDYVEYRIFLLVTCDTASMMHHVELIMKCPTIRLGISTEGFTYQNDGGVVEECPSHCASMAVSDSLPSPGISYGNGVNFLVTNARILC
jgi:hypothetical protein